ncbi:hypothetical protein GQ43DRAFT_488243 [Delitschia confertaspora ATCC 74209]|uniref:Uncharacterized protein n=1 Tax=Delitschia confertaspora ATCC 74209 TaxID=1513339 RepID=A0A9P4JXA5_9PLEO|nr:hypothetical protein GQ43DRAFT_488243 [Delitschia confertaspora ATCC 74209]
MSHTKISTISRPFDARHVAGVAVVVPGSTAQCMQRGTGLHRSSSVYSSASNWNSDSNWNPNSNFTMVDEESRPQHVDTTSGNGYSKLRPHLSIKRSFSRLRSRSSSRSRWREKPTSQSDSASQPRSHLENQYTFRISSSRNSSRTGNDGRTHPLSHGNNSIITRPIRSDSGVSVSGTAIDLSSVPLSERPLGFKEIMRISSLEERMKLYRRTREYWAQADHGLNEWVWSVRRELDL